MKAILIKTNNEVVVGDFTVQQMRGQFKSGFAEAVKPMRLNRKFFMVVDEEGLLNGSPKNKIGCHLYGTDKHGKPIVGDIFLCADIETDFGSLSDKEVQELKMLIDGITDSNK